MSLFKNGDIFVSTAQSKEPGTGNAMFVYDGVTLAQKAQYYDGTSDPNVRGGGFDGAWLDPSGNFWVLHWSTGKVEKWDPTGAPLWTKNLGAGTGPESVQFDRQGNAYIACALNVTLQKYDPNGTLLGSWAPAREDRGVDHIELHPDGRTLYYTSEGALIKRWDIKTNTQLADFVTVPDASTCYAVRRVPSDGSWLVVVGDGDLYSPSFAWVSRISASGTWMRNYPLPGYWLAFGMDMDADGQHFWVGAPALTTDIAYALKVNLATGARVAEVKAGTGVVLDNVDGVTLNVVKTKMPMLRVS